MTLVDDVKHAARRLSSGRTTSVAAVLMLALAIALSTAMFTLVDALLIRPVPFPHADRLAAPWMRGPRGGSSLVSRAVFDAWRDAKVFDAVEGFSTGTFVLGRDTALDEREGAFVSPALLPLLGAQPVAGRVFTGDEGGAGTSDRVLISERVWRDRFGSSPGAVGARMTLDGHDVTIVGVLPTSFRFPNWKTEIWRPLNFRTPPPDERDRLPQPVVRVAAGVPFDDAMKAATVAAHEAEKLPPDNWAQGDSLASPYSGQYARTAAPLFGGCAVMVFLVLCANVSGLLLSRFETRRREIGVATALGASRLRLMREALLESALLAAVGLALGVAMAAALVALARAYLPESLLTHTLNVIDLDVRALSAAALVSITAVFVAGVLPAWIGTRVSPVSAIRAASRGSSDGRAARTLRRALLVAEVALASALLAGAAILTRSFVELSTADRGIDPSRVVVASVSVGGQGSTAASRAATTHAVEESLRALPGVEQVAASFGAPPYGGGLSAGDWYSDVEGASPVNTAVYSLAVGQNYFDIYRIPLVRGRFFTDADADTAVVVGERFAALLWPGLDPVGRSFRMFKADAVPYQVVGVVREARLPTTEARRDLPEYYTRWVPRYSFISVSLRCAQACPGTAAIRDTIRRASPSARPSRIIEIESEYRRHVESPRAAAVLVLVFAGVAALAVGGGLFAMLAYAAGRRRREFGIRLALGARPGALRALVLREGATVVGIGMLLGAAGAWWMTRGLGALLYGVTPADPASWAAVFSALALVALAACWRPAARAARTDPSLLLREE